MEEQEQICVTAATAVKLAKIWDRLRKVVESRHMYSLSTVQVEVEMISELEDFIDKLEIGEG